MKNFLKFIRENFIYILKTTWLIMGILFTLTSFVMLWNPIPNNFMSDTTFFNKVIISIIILILILAFGVFITSIVLNNIKKIRIFNSENGHKVYVEYGDIFNLKIDKGKNISHNNYVIPVNRCFDTIVDNDLISEYSLHGKFMKNLYGTTNYDEDSLNDKLQKILKDNYNGQAELLNRNSKRKGNLNRYPAGTIAELKISNEKTYFLLGLSKFDKNLKASTSLNEFTESVLSLIAFCYSRSQGAPVFIPLFGIGLSRVGISKRNSLKLLVDLLKMNYDNLICDIHIVIYNKDKEDISIINF